MYEVVVGCVNVYCQLGNKLSEQVRKATSYIALAMLLKLPSHFFNVNTFKL